ncbi:MAG TPA: hypothetical protein VFW60_04700 [Rhodanobacteraceae bacterium]|nr:hypothetical protein [Rhodanobacteraceae bacterium]
MNLRMKPCDIFVLAIMATSTSLLPMAACAAAPPAAHVATSQTVIRTPTELRHYLKDTPANESPLSLLPAGARKRFLGGLEWGSKGGVGGFGFADLQQYLTDTQIHKILALFDLQNFDSKLHGRATPLTAAERHAPETPLEHKFDKLYFAREDSLRGGSRKPIAAIYDASLAPYQNPKSIAALDESDMRLLFRAVGIVASRTQSPRYLDDLRLDLATLHHRGLATPALVASVHDQLVAARQFSEANALAKQYPAAHLSPLPPLRQAPNLHDGEPTVLVMEPNGKAMLHKPVDMHAPLLIVVVAGCHFSVDAVRAVRADPQLDALFHKHAVWLADENESLTDVLAWNRAYPNQPMNVAWRNSEWPALDSWLIPTYYVFRNGKLADQWSGWYSVHDLKTHLAKAGLLD